MKNQAEPMTQDAAIRAGSEWLNWLARYCEQVANDGIVPTLAWFSETAERSRELEAVLASSSTLTRFDLLEDPERGLHAVLTRHGLASRTDFQSLVTSLVHWAADAYRSSQPDGNEQAMGGSCG